MCTLINSYSSSSLFFYFTCTLYILFECLMHAPYWHDGEPQTAKLRHTGTAPHRNCGNAYWHDGEPPRHTAHGRRPQPPTAKLRHTGTAPDRNCGILACAILKCATPELRHSGMRHAGPASYWTCAILACAIADSPYWHAP